MEVERDDMQLDEALPAPTGPQVVGLGEPATQVPVPAGAADAMIQASTARAAPALSPVAAQEPGPSQAAAQWQQQPQQLHPRPPSPLPSPAAAVRTVSGPPGAAHQQPGLSRLDREVCLGMLNLLAKYKEADPFRQPVDVRALNIPDYYDVVSKPMDFKTVREKVRSGAYQNMDEWRADMQLIWDNSRAYNGPEHPVTKQADKLAAALERRMSEAIEYAKAAVAAQDRGEPKPRTKAGAVGKGRSAELAALLGGSPFVTDSDSGDEQLLLGLTRAASTGRLGNGAANEQQRSPDAGRQPKRGLAGEGDMNGKSVRRKLPADAAGAGSVDMLALDALAATPTAKQLGVTDADDLAFLAAWKRVVARKQALQRQAAESDTLRRTNTQLRSSLAAAEESVRGLQRQLKDATAARQAEERARAAAEDRAKDLQRKVVAMQAQYQQQQDMLENQRRLLEQQQNVLRKLTRPASHQQEGSQPPAAASAAASAAAGGGGGGGGGGRAAGAGAPAASQPAAAPDAVRGVEADKGGSGIGGGSGSKAGGEGVPVAAPAAGVPPAPAAAEGQAAELGGPV